MIRLTHAPVREIVVSADHLEQLAWRHRDNPARVVEFTADRAYLALGGGVVYVALLGGAS